jgi:tetratricopeptide (TPR) repeat protein
MDLGGLKDIVKSFTQRAEQRAVSAALKCFAKGQLDKAIEILSEAKESSPQSIDILFDLSRYLILANRGSEAAEALRTALRRDPRSYRRASEMIEELRARRAHVGPLYDAVAEHFLRQDDLKAALEAMERMKPEEIRVFLPRHKAKWEGLRKNAPNAKMAKTSLQSAYYLALIHEALREYEPAAAIYQVVAKNNPEELQRTLPRLEALLAKDYHNAPLRVAVGDLLLRAGRDEEAAQQFSLALGSDPQATKTITERIAAHLVEKGERYELRWILVSAHLAAGDATRALEAARPLVEAGALLDQVVPALETLAASEKGGGAARLLLATAMVRRKQPLAAMETLLQIAEERGLPAIREPLEALVAADPRFVRGFHLLADVHLAEGRAAEAVACMRKARALAPGDEGVLVPKLTKVLETDPAAAEAHLLLADLLLKGGERERGIVILRHLVHEVPASAGEAVARLSAILKDDPQSPRARIGAAEACVALSRFPEALQHLSAVAASHPALTAEFLHVVGALAEASPDLHAGIADMLKTLEARTPLPHAVRFALGETAFHGGDLTTAFAAYRDVLQAAPERSEEVRQALERFDRDAPSGAEARYLLAMLYLDRRDHAAALAELSRGGTTHAAFLDRVLKKYEEILAASPDDLAARCGYVEALRIGRLFDRVLAVGQETLKLRDDETTARVSLAIGDALDDRKDPEGAVKRYYAAYSRDRGLGAEVIDRLRRLIASEGHHALASLALGKVLGSEGKIAEAVEALCAARSADPNLGDTVLAELERLREAAPTDPQPGLAMLVLLAEARESKQAIEVISTLLDGHPDLASVLAGHLDQILKADPQQPFATYEMGRAMQLLRLHARSAGLYLAAFRLDNGLAPMALRRLQEILEAGPTTAEPYLAACAIHAARGKFTAAAEKIQQALQKMPGEAERLLPRLEEICRQNRGNAQINMVFADACLRAGKFDKALHAFAEAARKDASLFDASFAGYEAVLKACPGMGEAYLARGRAHAQRLRADQALADLTRASRLSPELLPQIIEETAALRARLPESYACAVLLADLYMAAGRADEAARLLKEELDKGWNRSERLPILIRLWRLAAARQDEEAARSYLDEACRLAPDRNQFLGRVHEVHLATLRATRARLRDHMEHGSRRGADLKGMLSALVDLGEVQEVSKILAEHAGAIEPQDAARIKGEIALRRGEYPRATEHLKPLGPSRVLAFGAERAGDYALAARTLETLAAREDDPGLRASLSRVYREMVVADLMRGRRRLSGETTLEVGP